MTPRIHLIVWVAAAVVASALLTAVPANAAYSMPQIWLKHGAAEVGATYTAEATGYSWPQDVSLRYQWYRGNANKDESSYVPIAGATGSRYTLRDADHKHSVKALVMAYRNGSKIGERFSWPSNWVMYAITPPVLSGIGEVGQTITGKLGIWATEWDASVYWRRGADRIPGATSLSYTTTAADAGRSISMVGLGEYQYPNGVHPIDRRVTHISIRWGTQALLSGRSPAHRVLRLTAVARPELARQLPASGRIVIRCGPRIVKSTYLNGSKTITLRNISPGAHKITMQFFRSQRYTGALVSRTITVH